MGGRQQRIAFYVTVCWQTPNHAVATAGFKNLASEMTVAKKAPKTTACCVIILSSRPFSPQSKSTTQQTKKTNKR